MATKKTPERTGPEELRLIVSNMNYNNEGFNEHYTAEQLIQIYRMQIASGWDFWPDEWTTRQVKEALAGIVPQWNDNEEPIYMKKGKA